MWLIPLNMNTNKLGYSTALVLWTLFFCYATSAALLFQKFLLPLVPALHAGNGLLDGDSLYFHSVGVELAEKIRLYGWSSWQIYPAPAATGNIGILGALYALFGPDPALIIPINAAIHALGGVLIFKIGELLAPGRIGRIAGICTAVLFVAFPSALNWYGQVHKDGFAIAGTLLAIYVWLWIGTRPADWRTTLLSGIGTIGAALLIALVRPYNLIPLFAVMAMLFLLACLLRMRRGGAAWKTLGIYALTLALLGLSAAWAKKSGVNEKYTYAELAATGYLGDWQWKPSGWLPRWIDGYAEATARARAGLIVSGQKIRAGSMMDTDIKPDHVAAVAAYAPRAVQIALFAPFPVQWLEKISLVRLVSLGETLIWYLLVPGVVIAAVYIRSAALLMVVSFAALFLYIYGFTLANLGTLYRIRYPYLFLFMLVGAMGWTHLYLQWRRRASPASAAPPPARSDTAAAATTSRSRLWGASATVAIFTALTYAGLFLRDVILARWFGVSAELDALFIALAIPMFLVAVFSLPLGIMLIPQFLKTRAQHPAADAQLLISNVSFVYMAGVTLAAATLFFLAPELINLVGANFSPATQQLSTTLFRWMLPVLILSGLVVIGNSILNALGKYAVPASAQIAVPVTSILALVFFGGHFGVVTVLAGLFAGQALNLWIVATSLKRCAYSLWPRPTGRSPQLNEALSQYLPLVAAALFVNLAAPVNMGMASSLPEGSVAALGLGNKVVIFISGIVSTAVATVILPHFSLYMARNRLLDVRNELSFFLLAATVITIPAALLLFVAAGPIISLAFEGGAFGETEVQLVSRIMSYGIIQLPFFTVNLLILKFAVATQRAGRVMLVSLLGLAINVTLNLLLMTQMGVAGIALAATLAIALSTCFLLLLFYKLGHISWVDLLMMALSWMLFTTSVICLRYQSQPGVIVSILGLIVLLFGQWKILVRWRMAA